MNPFIIETIDGSKVVLKGIGYLFFTNGIPLSLSVSHLQKQGFKVSFYHLADELLKHGWDADKTISTMKDELIGHTLDWDALSDFCVLSYEDQRDVIFNSLFKSSEEASKWFRDKIKPS